VPNALCAFGSTSEELTMEQSAKNHLHRSEQQKGLRDPVCGMAVTAES